MELRLLHYFLTVAREENITRAAEVLHITQPTLSRQMAQLEEESGVRLFDRSVGTRKIALTSEGILLRRRAEEILELVDKTQHELAEQEGQVQGTIAIGCGEIGSVGLLPGLFRGFREKHPLVRFDVFTAANDSICERMEQGLLDFGILLGPPAMERYDCIFTGWHEKWVVLMPPDSPLAGKEKITAKDLWDAPLILPRGLHNESRLAQWFGRAFHELHPVVISNLTTNKAVLVRQGLGYALVIEGLVPFDPAYIVSRPLSPPLSSTSVLAWKRGQPFSRAATLFREYAEKELGGGKNDAL